jgi:hypothetical protein
VDAQLTATGADISAVSTGNRATATVAAFIAKSASAALGNRALTTRVDDQFASP